MRISRIALAALIVAPALLIASWAQAAPGDYRIVTGTVVWPIAETPDRAIVIQQDDGVTYFAELAPVASLTRPRAGERVSVLGREGFQPDQILFALLERRENVDTDTAPSALPTAVVSPPAANDIRQSPDVVVGTVESLRGHSLDVTNVRGNRVRIDVSNISPDIRRDLRVGEQVTVYAPRRVNGVPFASGILVDHSIVEPSAMPALPRQ